MQSIAGIINCLVSHKETNMQELYEQGEYLESGGDVHPNEHCKSL